MEKTLLLIDDSTDHIGALDEIKSKLQLNEGISVYTICVNPNERGYLNSNSDPELGLLIEGIKEKLISLRPNLIIVDQYYSGNSIYNGLSVIEKLRDIRKLQTCPIFLISGKREKIVREIFDNKELNIKDKVSTFSKLITYKIDKFLDKDFRSEAIQLLKDKNIYDVIPVKLRSIENQSLVINRFTPKHATIKVEELIDLIENNDSKSINIIDEMIGMSISYYSDLDEKL